MPPGIFHTVSATETFTLMGFLVNQSIDNQVFVVNGTSSLISKRVKLLEQHGAVAKVVQDRLVTPEDLKSLGRAETDGVVDGVFIVPSPQFQPELLDKVVSECRRLRIPVNVSEHPELCTFSLPSLHEDGKFQLAISTNGMGCRLANRIKRVAVNALPSDMGAICENVGNLRANYTLASSEEDEDDAGQSIKLNELVTENKEDRRQKLRWLSQMVEYYPLQKLRNVTEEDLAMEIRTSKTEADLKSQHSQKGSISLVGAGPGQVGLLTTEALQDINSAEYVLADKLVPEEVLQLVPRHVPVFIARKFPGNAERAQQELLEIGLQQLQEGKRVVRLKQGDPYIYGRGLEEYIFFKEHGFIPKVVAGITSAFSAPLLAQIAPTHRGYADQVLVCTGTGRAGKLIEAPEFVESRTVIFLMVLHRMKEVADLLISKGWDPKLPVASIERASCPDQRVIRSTLENIAEALETAGSRPPGLLVAGRACGVIHQLKDTEKWSIEE